MEIRKEEGGGRGGREGVGDGTDGGGRISIEITTEAEGGKEERLIGGEEEEEDSLITRKTELLSAFFWRIGRGILGRILEMEKVSRL